MTNISTPLCFILNYAQICGGGVKFGAPERSLVR